MPVVSQERLLKTRRRPPGYIIVVDPSVLGCIVHTNFSPRSGAGVSRHSIHTTLSPRYGARGFQHGIHTTLLSAKEAREREHSHPDKATTSPPWPHGLLHVLLALTQVHHHTTSLRLSVSARAKARIRSHFDKTKTYWPSAHSTHLALRIRPYRP